MCDHRKVQTHLIRGSASWEEVAVIIAMNRQVKDIRVVVKRLLSAVAMVYILMEGTRMI